MNTLVTFQSNKFPPYDGEEDLINPGLWGKRLAEYLVTKLNERGIQTEDIIPEDWGWYIPVKNLGAKMALCCGHQNGEKTDLMVFTDPPTPIIKKLFKRIDISEELDKLVSTVDLILKADQEIKNVQWSEK
jgi:hypothetical protein